jgi:hypothetical protein
MFYILLLELVPKNIEINIYIEIILKQNIEYKVKRILQTRRGKKEKDNLIK